MDLERTVVTNEGARFRLGYTPDGYAIWDRSGGTAPPVATYPRTTEGWNQAWWQFAQWEQPRSGEARGFAIASVALGILWFGGLGSILAVVFGFMARSKIKESGGNEKAVAIALIGIVLGGVE